MNEGAGLGRRQVHHKARIEVTARPEPNPHDVRRRAARKGWQRFAPWRAASAVFWRHARGAKPSLHAVTVLCTKQTCTYK